VFDGINVVEEGQRVIVKIAEPEELAGTLVAIWMKR
jgi:hypothetical protein